MSHYIKVMAFYYRQAKVHENSINAYSYKWLTYSICVSSMCEKTGALAIVEPGLTAGREAGRPLGRQICCKVRKFKFCIYDF